MGQCEHCVILRLCVAVHRVRLDVRFVAQQTVQDMDALVSSTRYEVAKQRNELVRHMVVPNSAVTPIADMVLGHQVLFIQIPFGAICRCVLARSPVSRQFEFVVGINDGDDGLVQGIFGHVLQI